MYWVLSFSCDQLSTFFWYCLYFQNCILAQVHIKPRTELKYSSSSFPLLLCFNFKYNIEGKESLFLFKMVNWTNFRLGLSWITCREHSRTVICVSVSFHCSGISILECNRWVAWWFHVHDCVLFLAALGHSCSAWLSLAAGGSVGLPCRGSSGFRAQASGRWLQQLWRTSLAALQRVESSQTGNWTRVSCNGRHPLNHWTAREFLCILLKETARLFSEWLCHFMVPWAVCEWDHFSTSLPAFVIITVFCFSRLDRCV